MDYIAFQGVVDERVEREIGLFERQGWNVRLVLIHPLKGWIVQRERGEHILVPSQIVSHPVANELFLAPIFILAKYLSLLVSKRREIHFLYVQNFPDVFSLPFLMLGKLLRVPAAYEVADPWKEFILTETEPHARARVRFAFYFAVLSIIEKIALSLATGVVYSSESLSEIHASAVKGKPTFLLYNYSAYRKHGNLSRRGAQLREKLKLEQDFVISYIGGFQSYRGIDILLESMVIVAKKTPAVKLLLVGAHGERLAFYQDRIRELGVEDKCVMSGWVDRDEIPVYCAASDVGIIPYKRTPATDLTCPNKLFNYFVLGKPVIVSRLRELSRYFDERECGLKVNPDDPQDLARAIVLLANDKRLVKEMKKNIGEINDNYRFENLQSDFLRFINGLAGRR